MTIGTRMATAAVSAEALPSRPETPPALTWVEIRPKAKKPPMMNQATETASAIRNGVRDGRCWSAKIRPPIEGTSSLAGVARRRCGGGPAGRRVRTNCLGGVVAAPCWLGASANSSGGLGVSLGASSAGLGGLGGSSRFASARSARPGDPSRLRCSALSRSAKDVRLGSVRSSGPSLDFSSRSRVIASRGFSALSLAPAAAPSDFACSCAITRSSQPTKTHERICALHPIPTSSGAERHSGTALISGYKSTRKGPRRISPSPVIVNEFLGLKKV